MKAPKIVVADDDRALLKLYESALKARGYQVWTAVDGEEALALVDKIRPDLLLDDVMMPNLHGLHVLDIVKGTPEIADTKVIMLTALDDPGTKKKSFALGAVDYIVKSQSSITEVLSRIGKALS